MKQIPNPNHRKSTFNRSRDMSLIVACAVIHRDGYKCTYCDRGGLAIKTNDATNRAELDHIIPRKDGGLSIATNLVTCCGPCNRGKQHGRTTYRQAFKAIELAHRPIDMAKGRELAMMHYPSRFKSRGRKVIEVHT